MPGDIQNAVEEYMNFSYEEKVEYVLNYLMQNQKQELKKQRYELPLAEYVALFSTFRSQRDLEEAGLWWKEVEVKGCEIITRYKDILKDPTKGYTGWEYPVSASTFEMSVEMPVVFEKIDGNSISLGVPLDRVELER